MHDTENELETYPFIVDAKDMRSQMGAFGWRTAKPAEIPELVALGERLIGGQLAGAETIARVHAVTQLTAWVYGDPIEGLFLIVPLSESGLVAVQAGTFSPGDPDEAHLASVTAACAGVYIGIYAGETHAARKAAMTASGIVRVGVFSQVPCFARAATEDGARSMASLGWVPAEFGADDLWMQATLAAPKKKVA